MENTNNNLLLVAEKENGVTTLQIELYNMNVIPQELVILPAENNELRIKIQTNDDPEYVGSESNCTYIILIEHPFNVIDEWIEYEDGTTQPIQVINGVIHYEIENIFPNANPPIPLEKGKVKKVSTSRKLKPGGNVVN